MSNYFGPFFAAFPDQYFDQGGGVVPGAMSARIVGSGTLLGTLEAVAGDRVSAAGGPEEYQRSPQTAADLAHLRNRGRTEPTPITPAALPSVETVTGSPSIQEASPAIPESAQESDRKPIRNLFPLGAFPAASSEAAQIEATLPPETIDEELAVVALLLAARGRSYRRRFTGHGGQMAA